jgi:hypothetical protein
MVFETGLYIPEVVFNIYMDDSTGTPELIGAGHGAGNNKIIFNDTMFGDGQTFFSNATGGSDCDDTDASTFGDTDGDGYTSCTTDCDDNDAAVNPGVDADMDGYSVCTDCNDTNANINPAMTEIWYDGVDRNCDGASDYDQDGDGAEVMTFTTNTGNLVVWGGLDCNDQNPLYHPLANETDPTLCYYDYDDDGYGDDSLSPTAMGYGAVEGSDCNDSYEFVYPGAAYNEMDVNGDGVTDCTCDYDGDGFGDDFPNLYYNAVSGTDLDDSDAHIH